jgi:hypothetical protein
VDGCSFLPLVRGEAQDWRAHLHGEHLVFGQSIQWLTDGHEKYVWFSGTGHEQLFNLDDDPQELHDLAQQADSQERLAAWRERLVAELRDREEGFVQDGQLVAGCKVYPCLNFVTAESGIDLRQNQDWHLRGAL